ncbi:MAG: GNAT family N-acetyltransferase [Clostridia bacterium]|nr:GNAT family N-acetyltransferase [Clostridia bacterium]
MTIRFENIKNNEDYIEEYREYTAEVDGEEVGYATVTIYTDGDVMVDRMDINEDQRNKGYGTQFITLLGKELGDLIVAPDNADAQRLWARLGEDMEGTRKWDTYYAFDQGFGVYVI